MIRRYNVIRVTDDLVVNTVLLNRQEPDTGEFRYVLAGEEGIGWTLPVDGDPVPPTPVAPPVTPQQIAAEIEALQSKLDAMKESTGV